ncbi:MAG TPA: STAS domain-containing protein, partial [Microterricola sp.]
VGSIPGILVAFVLALINLAKRASNPAIDVLAANDDPAESLLGDVPLGETTAKGVIVVRLAAPLFFANGTVFSDAVKRAINAVPEGSVQHLVVDMEAVTDVDVTAAEAFTSLHEWLDSKQIELSFSRVRLQALSRLRQLDLVGDARIFDTNRAAIAALVSAAP